MDLLYIKQFSFIEGFSFWHKYAIIDKLPYIKKTFWDTYPEIKNPNEIFKDGEVIKLKGGNKKLIIKILPKIHLYISNRFTSLTIETVIGGFVDFEVNKKIFFTLKDFENLIEGKKKVFNQFNYHKYTFQPQINEAEYFRLFPMIVIANQARDLNYSDSPIKVSTFQDMPMFKQNQIIKNWDSRVNMLGPTKNNNKKIASPLFLNPTYIIVEFSPFIDNENAHLTKLGKFFNLHAKNWNINRNAMIDITFYIKYLIDQPIRKRSKLDFLVDYIRKLQKNIFHLSLIRKIYKYTVVTRKETPQNGIYIVRKNGQLSNMVYYLNFDSIEFWNLEGGENIKDNVEGYFDLHEMFPLNKTIDSITSRHTRPTKNLYYFTSKRDKNFKLKDQYLVLRKTKSYFTFENIGYIPRGIQKLKKVDMKKIKRYRVIKKIYFLKKRYYHSDYISLNIDIPGRHLIGSVRPKGEKIIYIIKTD